jgi:hypothetical protein
MRLIIATIVCLALSVSPSVAQDPMPACDGDITIVRVSRIKPNGSIKGFIDAATAHEAWYRSNGITANQIIVARVFARDEATKTMKYSDTEVLSYHVRPPQRPPNASDAAWKAYVKQYQDNSEIVAEYFTCMPKPAGK